LPPSLPVNGVNIPEKLKFLLKASTIKAIRTNTIAMKKITPNEANIPEYGQGIKIGSNFAPFMQKFPGIFLYPLLIE
jgi:hypothetical protein